MPPRRARRRETRWQKRRDLYGPPLVLLGYWRANDEPQSFLPNVVERVDPDWDPSERRKVVAYLRDGAYAAGYMGYSTCRFCRRDNGSRELTDGRYLWPDGLAHYVEDHEVRLPSSFVAHVISAGHPPGRSDASVIASLDGKPEREQMAAVAEQLVTGSRLMDRGVDRSWWLATQGAWDA
jgi:hypothetical protein